MRRRISSTTNMDIRASAAATPSAAIGTSDPEPPVGAAGSARGAAEGVASASVAKADAVRVADGLGGGLIDWGGETESEALAGGDCAGVFEVVGVADGVGFAVLGVRTGAGVTRGAGGAVGALVGAVVGTVVGAGVGSAP